MPINGEIRADKVRLISESGDQLGILSISEALLQFDKDSDNPYVEIETSDQKFKRKNIEIGISDGINVEIISGINLNDKVKVWNRTQSENSEGKIDADDKDES